MEKIKIDLSNQQISLIKNYIPITDIDIFIKNGIVTLIGEKDSFHQLLEKLSNLLIEKGLISGTDEPNNFGLEIEDTIDAISHSIYS